MSFLAVLEWALISMAAVYTVTSALATVSTEELCLMETFNAMCTDNHVIVMESAFYGRMRRGRCAPLNSGNIGCEADVLRYFDRQCSGREECTVRVADENLLALNTCPQTLTPYLEAAYVCVPVISGRHYLHRCQTDGLVILTGPAQGILASSSMYPGGGLMDSSLCTWVIQAHPGQRINVTLVDFGLSHDVDAGPGGFGATCHKYAVLLERSIASPTTVCSGSVRERNIYLSKSHRLEIQLVDTRGTNVQGNFLLKYAFLGCPDPALNGNVLVERREAKVVLRCESTGQKFYMSCQGTRWNAQVPNCTANGGSGSSFWNVLSDDWSSTEGVMITVGIGIALGTIIGLILLFCALLCVRRRAQKKSEPSVYYESHTLAKGEMSSDDWDVTTLPVGCNTSRRSTKDGQYAHVWNPVNHDVMIIETTDLGRQEAVPRSRQLIDNVPSPPDIRGRLERAEHVYEKPK